MGDFLFLFGCLVMFIWLFVGVFFGAEYCFDTDVWKTWSIRQKIVAFILFGPLFWIIFAAYYSVAHWLYPAWLKFWGSLDDKPEIIGYSTDGITPKYAARAWAEASIDFNAEDRRVWAHFKNGEIKLV